MQVIDRILFAVLSAMSLALIFSIAMTAAHGESALKAKDWAKKNKQVMESVASPYHVEINASFY